MTDIPPKAKRRKAVTAHFGPVLAGGRLLVAGGDGQLRLFESMAENFQPVIAHMKPK